MNEEQKIEYRLKALVEALVEDFETYHELVEFTERDGTDIAHRLGCSYKVAHAIREAVKNAMNKHIEVVKLK